MFDYLQPRDGPVVEGLEQQEVVYAKDQPEYVPLRTLKSVGRMGGVISRWTLTPEQRKAVAEGADIYLELSTFHAPLQPARMAISDGKLDPRWVKMCLLNQALTPDEIETLEIVVPGEKVISGTGDFSERLERYKSELASGVTSVDEVRAAEGLPPSDTTTVRIGLGETISTPGTSNGKPAVILEVAPKPGPVGHDANLGKDLLPGAIVLEIHDSSGVQVLCEDLAKALAAAGMPVPFRMGEPQDKASQ